MKRHQMAVETCKTMTWEKDGRIARITLNRPERGNGIVPELVAELELFREAEQSSRLLDSIASCRSLP